MLFGGKEMTRSSLTPQMFIKEIIFRVSCNCKDDERLLIVR